MNKSFVHRFPQLAYLESPKEMFDSIRRKILRKSYYNLINKFADLETPEETIAMYPEVFRAMCTYNFKLKKQTIDDMFESLAYGNWKHLWETDEEKKATIEELCRELRWEVFYISDRMSWDRLIRTHWIWQRIMSRKWMEENDCNRNKTEKVATEV